MLETLERINGFIWGVPGLLLIVAAGICLSVCTGFVQLRWFPRALRSFLQQFSDEKKDGVETPYRALCTALAATVGTGNLAGVAGAIAIGGPGAVFWMWICGILGMMTKFAEAGLAVRYRTKNSKGEWVGGPMYMISGGLGMGWKPLAYLYAFFGVVASLGVGSATQINALLGGVESVASEFGFEISVTLRIVIGLIIAILIVWVLAGGAGAIGSVAERMVPIAAMGYIVLGCTALILCRRSIPGAFYAIFVGAFYPRAVTGGVVGSIFIAVRVGAARGVFTNEAGMGTAAIAHAAANVKDPAEQGLMGIMEVFLDTLVICTISALVILTSGVQIPYGKDVGIALTSEAFGAIFGRWVTIPIALALCCFAVATVLGWSLYGIRCAQFLFGVNVLEKFICLQGAMVMVGAVLGTGTVWVLSEMVNGLMAIPNLIALMILTPEVSKLTKRRTPIG